jgi:hypothetical protein
VKIGSRTVEAPVAVLGLGIALRCLVYFFLAPANNDAHISIIEFLVEHKAFPNIVDNYLTFHPPLYYLMAAPIFALSGSAKAVQALSLLFSVFTLIVLYFVIYRTRLVVSTRAKLLCLALVSFLPQFIMFSLYVSNDSLSFFLGALVAWACANYLERPSWKNKASLAIYTGLGLLTKTSFLAFVPVLVLFIFFVEVREARSPLRAIRTTSAFFLLVFLIGCYKYIDNYIKYKNPLINSLDVPVWSFQQRSFEGIYSYFDFNLLHLISSPSIPFEEVMGESASVGNTGAYPLLLYGTFWYQMIPESNFRGASHKPYSYLGSVIYLVALIPLVAFLIGTAKCLGGLPSFIRNYDKANAGSRGKLLTYVTSALLLLSVALLFLALVKYHVWTVMQGRYLFPCLPGILALFAVGVERLERIKYGAIVLKWSMTLLILAFCLYLSSEIGYLIVHSVNSGIKEVLTISH